MIAVWMMFAVLTGGAFTIAAIASDRIAALSRKPHRFIWLAAMVVTTCWPGIAIGLAHVSPHSGLPTSEPALTPGIQRLAAMTISVPAWDVSRRWTLAILVGWTMVSVALLARIALAVRYIRRRRAGWRTMQIDGVSVHVANDAGPAVVGLRRMQVVLPEWAVEMEPPLRELILRHESEHQSARDPYLLVIATLLTALFPWNPALWFQSRHLRIAIELDCDARVLHAHPRWREYAHLLLTIAQRRAATTGSLTPALSEATSNLERRIIAMRTIPTLSRLDALSLSVAAIAGFALACSVNEPQAPDRQLAVQATGERQASVASSQPAPSTAGQYFEFHVDRPATGREMPKPEYPPTLRRSGTGGSVWAQYVVDRTGLVDIGTFKVLKTPGPAFTGAVRAILPKWRFEPAEVGGKKVKQLVQQEFVFHAPPNP
jgi:hypothetical protein